MKKCFNTEGKCIPSMHYMVGLDSRLSEIRKRYVDSGRYFIINKGRQYGKTTILRSLTEYLKEDYIVLFLDFQVIGEEEFVDAKAFSLVFSEMFIKAFRNAVGTDSEKLLAPLRMFVETKIDVTLRRMFDRISEVCAAALKPVVLIIDEVDSASNNQVFLDFLSQLRKCYLDRDDMVIFHSVILSGVYDIKNLKLKIRPDREHKFNSPWNIAAKFDVKMEFSAIEIAAMLKEYEKDNCTGMDVGIVAEVIYEYTNGYPYLTSLICKILDEEMSQKKNPFVQGSIWSREGIVEAVKIILKESIPLFGSMMRQVNEYPDMKHMLRAILFQGRRISYNPDMIAISLAEMFGYIMDKEGSVQVSNRIFEMRLYNFFLSEEELTSAMAGIAEQNKNQFVIGGQLHMDIVLEKFVEHFTDIYGDNDKKFIEEYGRKFFLLYLKPIINGIGNYYIEAQTRDMKRTDVIVDYAGEQFIVELKIWYGNEYNERGEAQLLDYLEYYHLDKGYMLSFNFNKKKEIGIKRVQIEDKVIVEAIV